jgi:hypothetical protein
MATVTGMTAEAMEAIRDASIVNGEVDGSGHLILTTYGGTEIDTGSIVGTVSSATTSARGTVQLATGAEAITGTDTEKAITPSALTSALASFVSAIASLQPLDTDLTAIAGLSPSNDDVIQRKSGAWANRTMAQLAADLTTSLVQPKDADLTAIAGLSPAANDMLAYKSSAWANRTLAQVLADLATVGLAVGYLYGGSAYAVVNGPGIYVGSADPGSVPNGSIWFAI